MLVDHILDCLDVIGSVRKDSQAQGRLTRRARLGDLVDHGGIHNHPSNIGVVTRIHQILKRVRCCMNSASHSQGGARQMLTPTCPSNPGSHAIGDGVPRIRAWILIRTCRTVLFPAIQPGPCQVLAFRPYQLLVCAMTSLDRSTNPSRLKHTFPFASDPIQVARTCEIYRTHTLPAVLT